jgi:hypothetical protein
LGARNLSRSISNLQPSREVTNLLSRIRGTIRLEFSAEDSKFSASIIGEDGKFLTTITEFEEISRYKGIIRDAEKKAESTERGKAEVALLHNLKSLHKKGGNTAPDRMVEGNKNRLNQIVNWHKNLVTNLEIIDSLPESDCRSYLQEKGKILAKLYVNEAIDCVGAEVVKEDYHSDKLLSLGIPKNVENKLNDKAFTKDAKDAKLLLFPRGNYMKSVSLTTTEMKSVCMMNTNGTILSDSYGIIDLAQSDRLKKFFFKSEDEVDAEIDSAWEKLQWPLLASGTIEEYLEPRLKRVGVKHFTPTQAPRDAGKKGTRTEKPNGKKIRDMRNFQQQFMAILVNYCHFVPIVDDPQMDFWAAVFDEGSKWSVTPDKTLYGHIHDSINGEKVLREMKTLSSNLIKKHLLHQLCGAMQIPEGSSRFKDFKEVVLKIKGNDASVVDFGVGTCKEKIDNLDDTKWKELEDYSSLNKTVTTEINKFRGRVTQELQKAKRKEAPTGKNRLSSSVEEGLKDFKDETLRKNIRDWIRKSFRHKIVQETALELAYTAAYDEEDLEDSSDGNESSDSD